MARPTEVRGLHASTPLTEAGRKLLGARLADVDRQLAGARSGSVVAVHDLRVAARRLRAALELCDEEELSEKVARLQHALGAVRDLHVDQEWVKTAHRRLRLQRTTRELDDHLHQRLAPAEKKLRRELDRWSEKTSRKLHRRLERFEAKGTLGAPKLRRRFDQDLAKLERRLHELPSLAADAQLHRARISAKKLRYRAELLAPAWPPLQETIARLAALQGTLGELHDAHLRVERLDRAAEKLGPSALVRLTALAEKERTAAERKAQALLKEWPGPSK